jgi:formate hydrogenlyase subunit 3/multisubunit Na+/H+ antiporter MnhD subunit
MRQALPIIATFIAAAAMLAILINGFSLPQQYEIPFAVLSILVIAVFSMAGLFEKSLIKYVYYSAVIQFGYFALDVGTALLIGKSIWFAILQLINFTLAGFLFAIAIAILHNSVRKEKVPDYAGLYDKNQFLVLGLCVAALSLGGMPGFNIFVGEYLIYSALFGVHPALTLAAVFASLVAFIFYFRICYVMFAGTVGKAIKLGIISKAVIALLSLAVIGLGVIPHILLTVLEWFI